MLLARIQWDYPVPYWGLPSLLCCRSLATIMPPAAIAQNTADNEKASTPATLANHFSAITSYLAKRRQ
jgi:hypothetical protein